MTDRLTLDRLHSYMNAAGITDDDIIAGVELTHAGYQKVAGKFGMSLKDANLAINELMTMLRMEQRRIEENYYRALNEANNRYAYERDYLNNVTIRDTRSGEETYISGAEAAELVTALKANPEGEQAILANYADHTNHALTEEDDDQPEDSYESEINSKNGSYNFPWKDGGETGTATVVYSGDTNLRLVSVRNQEGDEIEVDEDRSKSLLRQAFAFIGEA
jgi:hypothetical protein